MIHRKNESPVDQRGYYNKQAEAFDAGNHIFCRANRNHYKKIDKIIDLLNCEKLNAFGGQILEVGMGTAIHAHRLLDCYPNVSYVGCDLSESMVDVARSRLLPREEMQVNCNLTIADGEKLPFKDNTFGGVFISGSLHHFSDPFRGLQEAVRVTYPGGQIAVMEPNWLFPTNFLPALLNKYERNILKMQKQNFKKWLHLLEVVDIQIGNFIYTPPVPQKFSGYYDKLDNVIAKAPLISRYSIMIYASATKRLEEDK